MTNINNVVAVVDILLRESKYQVAESLVNDKIQELELAANELHDLKKTILQQETLH